MYEHVIREAMQTPWAIERRYLAVIQDLLRFRASGGRLTAHDIEARITAADEKPKPRPGAGAVAVLPIYGVIAHRTFEASSGMTSTESLAAGLRRLVGDEELSTIVLDMCTPGGTVVGLPEFAAQVAAARETKYVVAMVNGEMCSAGYYIGSQANEIVSLPSAYCGSIGVWTMTEDWSEYLAKEGIKFNFISAGEHKCEDGRWWEPLPEETQQRLKSDVDRLYGQFLTAVSKGRTAAGKAISIAELKKTYGTGRVYNAKEALELGMIDRIATWDETIARLTSGRRRANSSTDGPFSGQAARDRLALADALEASNQW